MYNTLYQPPHSFVLVCKLLVVENVLWISVPSSLRRPAGDHNPHIVPLASLDRVVQVPDALVREKPLRRVVCSTICVRVSVVPEDPHQTDQVGLREQISLQCSFSFVMEHMKIQVQIS